MDAHGLLVKAWQRIEDPAKWCGNGMVGDGGSSCAWYALAVEYWCLPGCGPTLLAAAEAALLSAVPASFTLTRAAECATPAATPAVQIGRFNDHSSTTHDDIRALYLRAIAFVAPVPSLDFLASVTVEPAEALS